MADDTENQDAKTEEASQQDGKGAQLGVLTQFIKDLSFESPNAPVSLQGPGDNPNLQVNINVQANKRSEGTYEVIVLFEAQAKNDGGVIYNIELAYAGLFRLTNIPENILQPVLFVDCPALLFPFLRRLVADLTREGGFPPLALDPIDFAQLYRQNAERAKAESAAAPAAAAD